MMDEATPLYPAAKKARAIPGQTFVLERKLHERSITVGVVEKTPYSALRVSIFHWRSQTQIELHECERLSGDTFRISGADRAPLFIGIKTH